MKRFLFKVLTFIIYFFILILFILFSVNKFIEKGDYFTLDKSIKNIIIGPSSSQYAYNDSLIENTANLSMQGTNYFYKFYQVEKILESNSQIKNVFIDIPNAIFFKSFDQTIYDSAYLQYKYPNVSPFISFDDNWFLIRKNPICFINAILYSMKLNIKFIVNRERNYITYSHWGNFYSSIGMFGLKRDNTNINPLLRDTSISNYTISVLLKTIQLCKKRNVNVFLIRTPFHPSDEMYINEYSYLKAINIISKGICFLDFMDFPLESQEYLNSAHLNYLGARKYSAFFNSLMNDGLTEKVNPQLLINCKIEHLKKTKKNGILF